MYLAKSESEQIYLSTSTQMDYYLSLGYSIFIESGETQTLIATPEDGYLIEKPVFPEEGSWSPWTNQ